MKWVLMTAVGVAVSLIAASPNLQAQPEIEVEPDFIEVDFPEFENEFVITIGNLGDAVLRWRAEIEIVQEPERQGPRRDDPGDQIGEFRGINAANQLCSPVGWDWDNDRMWIINFTTGMAAAYRPSADYQEFEETIRLNLGQGIQDGAWIDGVFILSRAGANRLERLNEQGQNLGAVQMQFQIAGVAADAGNDGKIILMDVEDGAIHVFEFGDNGRPGEEIGVIENHVQFHDNAASFGLEWVSRHVDGQLWMSSPDDGHIHQIVVEEENWECQGEAQSFPVFRQNESPWSSVAHDGQNLWAGGLGQDNIRIIDDGITEHVWITLEPMEGSIEPREEQELICRLDPAGLREGDYGAHILIYSNDPNIDEVVISVIMHVIGVPLLEVEWDDDFGYPEAINFNMAYQDVFVNHLYEIPIIIRNGGTDDLEIMDIITDREEFAVGPEEGMAVLSPGERLHSTARFIARETGVFEGPATFVTNDLNREEYQIFLFAEATNPPIMVISPEEFEYDADDSIIVFAVDISNEGESDLRWAAEMGNPEDLVRDETEITINPAEGTIPSGQNQTIELTFRLIELERAEEEYYLHITSNDPENPSRFIHIIIHWPVGVEWETLPRSPGLVSIYPNPFNNRTTISFDYGPINREATRISVYGVDGKLVDQIGNRSIQSGTQKIVWDAGDLPAGSYLVRLTAGLGVVEERWVRLIR